MVKAFHRAGIEVILDVVFNHTAEGGRGWPDVVLSRPGQRALLHPREGQSRYADYTGCGNTLNANQPIVRRLIQDSLRYWVTRDARRRLPLRSRVDPVARRDRPPAAEPAGPLGHRVGSAAGRNQADRGGVGCRGPLPGRQLRRRRLAGVERPIPRRRPPLPEEATTARCPRLAARLLGSPDIYGHEEREAEQSINFVTLP